VRQAGVQTEGSLKRRQAISAVATFLFVVLLLAVTYLVVTKTAV
jgi:hypothetical protein